VVPRRQLVFRLPLLCQLDEGVQSKFCVVNLLTTNRNIVHMHWIRGSRFIITTLLRVGPCILFEGRTYLCNKC